MRRTRTYKLFRDTKTKVLNITTSLVMVASSLGGAMPLFLVHPALAASAGDVEIVAAMPDPSPNNPEYVTVENLTASSINLNNWKVDTHTISATTALGAGSTATICENGTGAANCTSGYSISTVGLNNKGDTVTLYDGSGNQIDQVSYTEDQVTRGQEITFAHAPAVTPNLTAGDFATWDNSPAFKGIDVGFSADDFGTVSNVTVNVTRADGSHVIKTADTGILNLLSNKASLTTASAPIIVQPGTYDEADGYWNPQTYTGLTTTSNWDATTEPTSVTVTVTGENGTRSVTMSPLTETAGASFTSLLPTNQPPTIALTNPTPADNSLVGDSFSVGYEANDDHGFKAIVVGLYDAAGTTYLRDCTMATNVASTQYTGTCTVDTTGLTTGNYTVEARVQDSDGVYGTTAKRTVFIDRTAPEVSFTTPTPADDSYLNGNFTAAFTASDNYQLKNLTVALYNTDGTLASSNFYAVSNVQIPNWSGTYTFDLSNIADGTYVIKLRAQDMAGNYATDAVRTIHIDRTAPTVTLAAPTEGSYLQGSSNPVIGTVQDAHILGYAVVLADGTTSGPNDPTFTLDPSSPLLAVGYTNVQGQTLGNLDTTHLAEGQYTIVLAAIDQASNISWTVSHVTVDHTKPTATFTSSTSNPTPNGYVNGDFVVGYDVRDNDMLRSVNVALFDTDPHHTNHWAANCYSNSSETTNEDTGTCTVHLPASLPDGTYYAQVGGRDAAGLWTVNAKRTIYVQRAVPVQPTDLKVHYQYDSSYISDGSTLWQSAKPGNNNLELTWSGEAGDWVTGHHILATYPDGTTNVGYQGPNTNAWLNLNGFGQHGNGKYTYSVVAVNPNGESVASSPFTLYYDTQSPTASFTSSVPTAVNGNFQVTGVADDNVGLSSAFFDVRDTTGWVAGCVAGTFDITYTSDHKHADLSCTINTSHLVDGQTYTVRIHAADNTQHYGGGSQQQVTFDTTRPTVAFTTPTNFSSPFKAGPNVTVNASDTGSGLGIFVIHAYNAADNSAAQFCTASTTELAAGSMSCDLSDLPDGTYYLLAGANDKAGNNATVNSGNFIIDSKAPALTINPSTGTDTTPTLTGTTDDDPAVVVSVALDGGTAQAATNNGDGTWSFLVASPLSIGKHTVAVTATDLAGNATQETATVTVEQVVSPQVRGANTGGQNTNGSQTVTVAPNHDGHVLGASTTTVDTSSDTGDTNAADNGKVRGDNTVKLQNASDTKGGQFLGLGWWWLLILAVVLGLGWFVLAAYRRSDED